MAGRTSPTARNRETGAIRPPRRIAVVTGTRADYGLLYWILKELHADPAVDLQLIVTGTHLSGDFGMTVREIEADQLPIAARVAIPLSDDSGEGVAISMSVAMRGVARALARLRPDLLLVVGDRFEILSAVASAVPLNIPVAHIHGGEVTKGAMDELFRHAITKMSHLHFAATRESARRIVQMGEPKGNVYCVGAPGLDTFVRASPIDRQTLATKLNLPVHRPWGLVTYHPVTQEKGSAGTHVVELLKALDQCLGIFWVLTGTNADMEGRTISAAMDSYAATNSDRARVVRSMGRQMYPSMLKESRLMVGNSSSGIIEAASVRLPVVNIGSRQEGRLRARNVIDVPVCRTRPIAAAIRRAMSAPFRKSLTNLRNPYGDGHASSAIVATLRTVPLSRLQKKTFVSLSPQVQQR